MNSLSFLHSLDQLSTISRQSFANFWNGRATLIVGIALLALGCLTAACCHIYHSCLKAKKIAPWNAKHKQALKDFAAQKLLQKEERNAILSQLENEKAQIRLRQDPCSSLARLEKAMLLEKKINKVPYNLIVKYAIQAGPFLTKLDLQGVEEFLNDQDLEDICQSCPNLEELHLGPSMQVKGLFIAKLPQKLKLFDLKFCDWVTDAHIAKLPSTLESLTLAYCQNVKFKQAFPSGLQSLSLMGCFLKPEDLTILLSCKCLKSLDLAITGLMAIPKLPPQLESLDLSHCHVTDADMAKLPPHLKSLNVSFCLSLSNAAFATLPSTLTSLALIRCRQLTDQALAPLAVHTALESLEIAWCENFTDAALANLPPHLKSLGLRLCHQLTEQAIHQVALKGVKVER